jgi:hypothetical protein
MNQECTAQAFRFDRICQQQGLGHHHSWIPICAPKADEWLRGREFMRSTWQESMIKVVITLTITSRDDLGSLGRGAKQ